MEEQLKKGKVLCQNKLTCMCTLDEPVSKDRGDPPGGTPRVFGPCCCPDQQVAVPLPQGGGVLAAHDGDQVGDGGLHIFRVR